MGESFSQACLSGWLIYIVLRLPSSAKRFGSRKRVPLSHIPKVQSQALLQESATTWASDFSLSSGRRFREIEEDETDESKIGDIHAVWLGALLLVERSREAMRTFPSLVVLLAFVSLRLTSD